MIFDTHIHTHYSIDSHMNPQEAIDAASKLELGLCVTEHVDYECDTDDLNVFDMDEYFTEYGPYKSENFLLGIEIGLTVNTRAIARKTASDPRLDFCLGSVHLSYGHDMFYPSFWRQSIPAEDIMGDYLKYTAKAIDMCDFFDSLGHIDYPSRYCPFRQKNIKYKTFKKLYDEIFAALLDKKKVIEINTKRMNDMAAAKNLFNIYEGYYACGGRYVTLGSDAHSQGNIGRDIDKAFHMAKKIGLTPVRFAAREMIVGV